MSKIIVLIPHYNNVIELKKSLISINETQEVDVLVIDDGSNVKPNLSELQSMYNFGNIFLENLKENQGIENALNKGLEIISASNYEYIGRLDCGDYCVKNRFVKQLEYLENNKDIFLLGTWANIIDKKGENLYLLKHPITYNEIKKKMFINNMFIHPSVVFRKDILKQVNKYPINYEAAEDYAFFFEIIKKFKAENYPEPLLNYVIDANSISSKKRFLQVKSRIRIILHNFRFSLYPIYGLLRNSILLFMSRDLTTLIKNNRKY